MRYIERRQGTYYKRKYVKKLEFPKSKSKSNKLATSIIMKCFLFQRRLQQEKFDHICWYWNRLKMQHKCVFWGRNKSSMLMSLQIIRKLKRRHPEKEFEILTQNQDNFLELFLISTHGIENPFGIPLGLPQSCLLFQFAHSSSLGFFNL